MLVGYNNVLLVKIEGPVWYTIYHHRNLSLKGFLQTPLLINQPVGKGHLWLAGSFPWQKTIQALGFHLLRPALASSRAPALEPHSWMVYFMEIPLETSMWLIGLKHRYTLIFC